MSTSRKVSHCWPVRSSSQTRCAPVETHDSVHVWSYQSLVLSPRVSQYNRWRIMNSSPVTSDRELCIETITNRYPAQVPSVETKTFIFAQEITRKFDIFTPRTQWCNTKRDKERWDNASVNRSPVETIELNLNLVWGHLYWSTWLVKHGRKHF